LFNNALVTLTCSNIKNETVHKDVVQTKTQGSTALSAVGRRRFLRREDELAAIMTTMSVIVSVMGSNQSTHSKHTVQQLNTGYTGQLRMNW